ncbi:FG-GAP-like repeat-containing protein [Granulicella aggregans]|uniref:FG-GAP-like repeat-containing protein n=1 Tax=Granulicella aggregans TaxID=474949 RepID=UPI0021E054C9|nr:FG-GAP-like repeat-containing protein [Granulicella aggregans]
MLLLTLVACSLSSSSQVLSTPSHTNPKFLAKMEARQKRSSESLPTTRSERRFMSPFERQVLPALKAMKNSAGEPVLSAIAKPMPNATQLQGVSVNFPGFVAAPAIGVAPATDAYIIDSTAVGDFNGDGLADLATLNGDGELNIALNPGKGKFSSSAITHVDTSALDTYVSYIAAADLNGDGKADLVGLDYVDNDFLVWISNGDGTFKSPVIYNVSTTSGAELYNGGGLVVGDVNGDSVPDIVVLTTSQNYTAAINDYLSTFTVQSYINRGDSSFSSPQTESDSQVPGAAFPQQGEGLILADMNGDGNLDLAIEVTNQSGAELTGLVIANGDGTGAFSNATYTAATVSSFSLVTSNFSVADLNGDGSPDVLFNVGDGNVYVSFNDGKENFSGPKVAVPLQPSRYAFALADLNGDGKPDIVTYDDGAISLYPGNGDGTFSSTASSRVVGASQRPYNLPTIADFNGDGLPDVLDIDTQQSTAILDYGLAGGKLAGAAAVSYPSLDPTAASIYTLPASNLSVFAEGDANGDGYPDIIAEDLTNIVADQNVVPFVTLLNDGKGNFTKVIAQSAAEVAAVAGVDSHFVDLNGDGIPDLVELSATGYGYAAGKGDGTFSAYTPISLGISPACPMNYATTGDLTGKGSNDIVFAYPGDQECSGSVVTPSGYFVSINDGKGHFTTKFYPSGLQLLNVALGDFNGDGKLDLAFNDNYAYDDYTNVYLAMGNGNGTFSTPTTILSGYLVTSLRVADYNQDGKPDVALSTAGLLQAGPYGYSVIPGTQGVLLMPNQGSASFGPPTLVAQGTLPFGAAFADFNNDGLPDLAISAYSQYDDNDQYGVVTYPNLGGGDFGPYLSEEMGTFSTFTFVDDFNHDGAPDVLAVNDSANGLFLNQGASALKLVASQASAVQGASVTLTATLTTTFTANAPQGNIVFSTGGAMLGTGAISGGVATLTTAALPVGTNLITAAFAGDGNFNAASATESVAVTALAPAIALQSSSASLSLPQGNTGSITIGVTANTTYNGSVSFTASGAEQGLIVTVSPSTVTLTHGAMQMVTVVVASASSTEITALGKLGGFGASAGGVGLAAILFFLPRKRRKKWHTLTIAMVAGLLLVVGATGCGGSAAAKVAAKGQSTITITATPSVSGATAQTTTLTVTVQ